MVSIGCLRFFPLLVGGFGNFQLTPVLFLNHLYFKDSGSETLARDKEPLVCV